MSEVTVPVPSRLRWLPTIMLVAAACAGTALWSVARRPSPALPPAPGGVVVGVPSRTLRFAAYNIYRNFRGMDRTVTELRKLDPMPDFLMLSEVDQEHVDPMGDALGMPHRFHPPPPDRGAGREYRPPDVALLSRHPLFDGRALDTGDGAVFGLIAFTVVHDRKFAVAGVQLWPTLLPDARPVLGTTDVWGRQLETLRRTWQELGRPPLVVGAAFTQPAAGEAYRLMTGDFNDTLGLLGETGSTYGRKLLQLRIDYLLATPDWEPMAGGVIRGNASDHRPVWVDLRPAAPGATTRTAAQPAT